MSEWVGPRGGGFDRRRACTVDTRTCDRTVVVTSVVVMVTCDESWYDDKGSGYGVDDRSLDFWVDWKGCLLLDCVLWFWLPYIFFVILPFQMSFFVEGVFSSL